MDRGTAWPPHLRKPVRRAAVVDGADVTTWHSTTTVPGQVLPRGSASRLVRALAAGGGCCPVGRVVVRADGTMACARCEFVWTASHSAGRVLAACSAARVGADLQTTVPRPAALRWLGRVTGTEAATVLHWALSEAYLKAVGRAFRLPLPTEFGLPALDPEPSGPARDLAIRFNENDRGAARLAVYSTRVEAVVVVDGGRRAGAATRPAVLAASAGPPVAG